MFRLRHVVSQLSTPIVLSIVFAAAYLAIGPGCFFSVDEVVVEEMAQAVYRRGTLEIPAMNTAIPGRARANYAHRGPALGYVSLPFVAAGNFLDDQIGSMQGGTATGSPLGTLEHPLRWGGRFSIFGALITNAIAGGLTVAILFLIALRFGVTDRVAVAFACATGGATLLVSESTHFFQHLLETFSLLAGFWFLSGPSRETVKQYAWLGGLSLGLAVLARPNSALAAAVIWLYGAIVMRSKAAPEDRREWLLTLARSAAPLAGSTALYLMYNYVQFGNVSNFGYGDSNGILQPSLTGPVRALAAYLVSPTLSVFLFAPLLLLIPLVAKESLRRWPLETKCLLLASAAHFVPIAFLQVWDGAIAYGPRYVLASMLLVMPLALPAFEKAFEQRLRNWRIAMACVILLGAFVQIVGVSVYVTTNEWYYNQQNIYEDRAFVFIPSASPVWVQLRDLVAGRNIIPWAWRAISRPGPAFAFLAVLLLSVAAAVWLLRTAGTSTFNESAVPRASVLAMGSLILLGFFATITVVAPLETRIVNDVNAGLAAQQAGRDVEAEETYALVLSLDPANKFALHNLALLYEKIGKPAQAVSLYERAVVSDPAFTPSVNNLSRFSIQERLESAAIQECASAAQCYEAGKRSWDLGNKAAALSIWEHAAGQFPAQAFLVRNVARARYDLTDYEGAARDYRKAAALSPSDDGIRTDLAWALLAASRFDEAREICNEVLAHDRGNAAAREVLARLPK